MYKVGHIYRYINTRPKDALTTFKVIERDGCGCYLVEAINKEALIIDKKWLVFASYDRKAIELGKLGQLLYG
jgi:hypothetical protein